MQIMFNEVSQDETYYKWYTTLSLLFYFIKKKKKGRRQGSWFHQSDLQPTEGLQLANVEHCSNGHPTCPELPAPLDSLLHLENFQRYASCVSRGDARTCCPGFFISRAWFFSRTHARLGLRAGGIRGAYAQPSSPPSGAARVVGGGTPHTADCGMRFPYSSLQKWQWDRLQPKLTGISSLDQLGVTCQF